MLLLPLQLFRLHLDELLVVAVQGADVEARKVRPEEGLECGKEMPAGSVGAGGVVNDELVVGWVMGRASVVSMATEPV